MELSSAIAQRVSALKLADPGPDRHQVQSLLAAALQVPDHGMLEPTRFVVVDKGRRSRFADLLEASLLRRRPDSTTVQIAAQRKKAFRAPVIIIVAAHVIEGHKVPVVEQIATVAAGIQNMFLLARDMGLGVMWKTGAPAYDPQFCEDAGLQADDRVVGMVYVGSPVTEKEVRSHDASKVAQWL